MDFVFKEDPVWEVVLDARPDTVYENTPQAITNKTNIETLDLTVRNNVSLPNIGDLSDGAVYNLKYLVGIGNENQAKWTTDLSSNYVLARQGLRYLAGAGAG